MPHKLGKLRNRHKGSLLFTVGPGLCTGSAKGSVSEDCFINQNLISWRARTVSLGLTPHTFVPPRSLGSLSRTGGHVPELIERIEFEGRLSQDFAKRVVQNFGGEMAPGVLALSSLFWSKNSAEPCRKREWEGE